MVRLDNHDRSTRATLARWITRAVLVGPAVAAVAGLVEAIAVYPVSSWFGVTLYLAVLAVAPSVVLGVLVAASVLVVRRHR